MADIFFSYARADRRRVEPIVRFIEAQGWTVWWDPDIDPGQHFHRLIEKEIEGSSCVIVAWSNESIKSKWVLAEAQEGLGSDKLVPILLDDCRPPILFRPIHTANLTRWSGDRNDSEINMVLRAVSVLSRSPTSEAFKPPLPPQTRLPAQVREVLAEPATPSMQVDQVHSKGRRDDDSLSTVVQFKYKAYITYSHRDTAIAHRIHRDLERMSIPKELVGRQTVRGTVPRSLRPIFRERAELSAGQDLEGFIRAALEASEALIVVCSPAAAKSHYVNEEIRLFKQMRPEQPILPIFAEFDEGVPIDSAMPPMISDGQYLVADTRRSGDGRELATVKIAAGLLGLPVDELYRRVERMKRQSVRRVTATLAAALTIALGLAAFGFYYRQLASQQQLELERLQKQLELRRSK